MSADRHAELRAVAEEGWDTRSSAVIRLLDEIAELRHGYGLLVGLHQPIPLEQGFCQACGTGVDCETLCTVTDILARADAIGGGE